MTEQEMTIKIQQLEKELNDLKGLFFKDNFSDLDIFRKKVEFKSDVTLGTSLKATTDKLGFYQEDPVAQQSTFTAPTGGGTIDAESRTAINAIKTILTNVGLTT